MTDEKAAAEFRLFVAIALPEAIRSEIARAQRELSPLVPRAVARWTRPDQFHLTLRFLGDVSVEKVEAVAQAVSAVCQEMPPLLLRAEGVGFFPHARSPRVVWVGVNDQQNRLIELQQRLETVVAPFSSGPGEKNFTGHVTLARLKNLRLGDGRELAAQAQTLEKRRFGDWTAEEVEIIRSELSSAGAQYTILAACRLGEAGPAPRS